MAYRGDPILLDELLYKPDHSLIHQSTHAHEREEPLNGDGWGVGWYEPRLTGQPGLYRTVSPAWSDDNMRHVSKVVQTPTFLAHVRAASPGLPVQQLNCHPFIGGIHGHDEPGSLSPLERARRRLLFMHNGQLGAYKQIIRELQRDLPDDLFFGIDGSTDSEHAFAVIQDALGGDAVDPTPGALGQAICQALSELAALKEEVGQGDELTQFNVCLTDGRSMVATRYVHPDDGKANSLYVGQAETFACRQGRFQAQGPEGTGSVLIASEALWDDDRVWEPVPANHMVLVDESNAVTIEPMDVGA